jgi:CubicO group peptidase (beta-lactamase class C family)
MTDTPLTDVQKLDALFAPYSKSDQPGLVVGIARHGKTIYRRGFGLASLDHAIANSPATRMRIGSTSKHFTCLAALLLAEEGKLDLDAPVTAILTELPALKGAPTLRNFMSHTGGYRCYLDLSMMAAGLAVQPEGDALQAQVRQTDVNFEPNDGQLYNNGGYHLLSIAIARASGMSFEDFMKTRIFEPLGMVDTISAPSDRDVIPGMATLHLPGPKGGWRKGIFMTEEIRGEGAMVSTIDDMLRWLAHLNGPKRIGSAASWEALKSPAVLKDGYRTVYGLGLFLHDYRGVAVVHHGGSVIGGTCAMLTAPDHGLDIVMMANGGPAALNKLQFEIVDALLADVLTGPPAVMATAERFKHLDGVVYHQDDGSFIGFGIVEDKLGISLNGSPPMPVLRDEGDILRIGFEDVAMGPFVFATADLAAVDGQAPATLRMSETGRVKHFTKLPATPPTVADVAAAWVGRWHSHDLGAEATVTLADDTLTLRVQAAHGSTAYKLEPLSDRVAKAASTAVPGFSLSCTLDADGKGFIMTGGRSRHIAFQRVAG